MEATLRGRQAEARLNDRAILEAARTVFASDPTASVAQVAATAGVGVASLYRRFDSKQALLEHLCLVSLTQQSEAAERALATTPEWRAFVEFVETCVERRIGVFSAFAGTITVTPELARAARKAHRLAERLVQRTRENGGLRGDVSALDVQDLIEIFSRRLPDTRYQRPLAVVLDGLRRRGRTTPPGAAPVWADDELRWLSSVQRTPTSSGVRVRSSSSVPRASG